MKKLALLGLVSLFLLSGAAGADQAGEQKGASPMGGMMEQMMSGTDMGGMGGMMGMMNMMTGGGGKSMMGFGGYQGMMSAFGLFSSLFGLVVLIDLILLGIWLWKQIQKK